MKTILHAAWVAPMDGPVLRDAGVAFDGPAIVAVGPIRQLCTEHPEAARQDLGESILLPGLINAHTHLELSNHQAGPAPEGGFIEWLSRRREPRTDLSVGRAVADGVQQCLRFGVTAVGDITKFCQASRRALAEAPIRAISYGEVVALGRKRGELETRLALAEDGSYATSRLTIGISPHAPYTVEAAGYRRCLELAKARGLPLATHLAESNAEEAFLRDYSGPFRELWEKIGLWDEPTERFEGGPIRLAEHLGLLEYPTLLAHVNYCDDGEMAVLARGRASVVYCPRTHAYFGHPPHRWRKMLARGINVAVGTDSCASCPDLNLVDDLRALHALAPQMPAAELWAMATWRAARAIGQEMRVGSLSPSKAADLVAFAAQGPDPLKAILESPLLPQQVWIGGEPVG